VFTPAVREAADRAIELGAGACLPRPLRIGERLTVVRRIYLAPGRAASTSDETTATTGGAARKASTSADLDVAGI
jgi:hypothetical protein